MTLAPDSGLVPANYVEKVDPPAVPEDAPPKVNPARTPSLPKINVARMVLLLSVLLLLLYCCCVDRGRHMSKQNKKGLLKPREKWHLKLPLQGQENQSPLRTMRSLLTTLPCLPGGRS